MHPTPLLPYWPTCHWQKVSLASAERQAHADVVGSEVQESILAAITSILGSLQTGDTVHEEVQRRLGGVLRDKKMTKHARQVKCSFVRG